MDKSAAVYPLAVHVLPYGQDKYPSPVGGFEGIKGTLCNMKVDITPPPSIDNRVVHTVHVTILLRAV